MAKFGYRLQKQSRVPLAKVGIFMRPFFYVSIIPESIWKQTQGFHCFINFGPCKVYSRITVH